MTGTKWDNEEILRRLMPPRRLISWLLLAVLVMGAASYLHGSRYGIVPAHGALSSGAHAHQDPPGAASPADAVLRPGVISAHDPGAVRAMQQVSWSGDAKVPPQKCCERRSAPRSEPVPLRAAALDQPLLLAPRPNSADGIFSALPPPEPDLRALTVLKLSISRT